ncbi:MAG: hypothetical protein methR_P3099 [Methyloprofundus sp.]|nr:MAG: hypothetical protein methR_P3099 [Methyloprofundus sp.]
MASPRVFISSTCFDLAEVRDSLMSFCQGFGFEVVMSDKGDVFYHPDLHTHESCITEISNCQLFILIVGGRFGGKYKVDPTKSITNAEYNAAKEAGIPVFTFVKEGVLADHHIYQKNREKDFVSSIDFPSIENQNYAVNIFDFIDLVRGANVNNGFFDFKYARDIHCNLRKQWAGMFFDFLSQRSVSNHLKSTNESIANLSIASKKIEELIKGIYRQVDNAGADDSIHAIDAESNASKFFAIVGSQIDDSNFIPYNLIGELSKNISDKWWEFLLRIKGFELVDHAVSEDGRETRGIFFNPSNNWIADIDGNLNDTEKKSQDKIEASYKAEVSQFLGGYIGG